MATGCIPALQNRVPARVVSAEPMVAMPPQALVYTLDSFDDRAIDPAVSLEIGGTARPLVESAVTAHGGRMARAPELEGCGAACLRFFHWGRWATLQIGVQRQKIRNFGPHTVSAWAYPGDLPPVREAFKTNFVLFVVLKQTRETAGRGVAELFSGWRTVGKQIDVACVADLGDGRMTWCTSLGEDLGDIARPGRVPVVIQELMQRLFDSAPGE